MAKGFFSPKLTLHVGDGFEFMKQNQDAFDVIITDSSDPVGKCHFLKHLGQLLQEWVIFWIMLQDPRRVCSRSLIINWWRRHWEMAGFFVPKVTLYFSTVLWYQLENVLWVVLARCWLEQRSQGAAILQFAHLSLSKPFCTTQWVSCYDAFYVSCLSGTLKWNFNSLSCVNFTGESQWLHLELIKEMQTFCKALFPVVDYAYSTIPTYPSGQIGFMLCSKNSVSCDTYCRHLTVAYKCHGLYLMYISWCFSVMSIQ